MTVHAPVVMTKEAFFAWVDQREERYEYAGGRVLMMVRVTWNHAVVTGNLITARRILDRVRDGTIDVGPLDAYWHMLIARHAPEIAAGVRVLESTDTAPMPAFVASPSLPARDADALRAAFAAAATRPWFAALADTLLLDGFKAVTHADFATTLAWDRAAKGADYPLPA